MQDAKSQTTRKADAGPSRAARKITKGRGPNPAPNPIPCTGLDLVNKLYKTHSAILASRYDRTAWLCQQIAGTSDDARPWLDAYMPKHASIKRSVAIDRFKWEGKWWELILKTYPGYAPEIYFLCDDTTVGHTGSRKAAGQWADEIEASRLAQRNCIRRGDC